MSNKNITPGYEMVGGRRVVDVETFIKEGVYSKEAVEKANRDIQEVIFKREYESGTYRVEECEPEVKGKAHSEIIEAINFGADKLVKSVAENALEPIYKNSTLKTQAKTILRNARTRKNEFEKDLKAYKKSLKGQSHINKTDFIEYLENEISKLAVMIEKMQQFV